MILEKTIPLLLIFLLALLLKTKGILHPKDSKVIGKLLINIVIPVLVFKIVSNIQLKPEYAILPLIGIAINVSFLAIIYFWHKIFTTSSKRLGSDLILFPSLEGGTVGYILMLAAFGEFGLSQMVFFDLGNGIFLFTALYFVASLFNPQSKGVKHSLFQFLKTPMLWAIAIGFLANALQIKSTVLNETTSTISSCTIFLVMIMLGLECKFYKKTIPKALLFVSSKVAVGLLLAWTFVSLFQLDGLQKTAIYMGAALPPSVVTLLFSEEHNLDTEWIASILSVALPFSFLYYPIALYLLGY